MKKLLFILLLLSSPTFGQDTSQHWCGSHDKLHKSMQSNLQFATKLQLLDTQIGGSDSYNLGSITIPVVIHIVYGDSNHIPSMEDITRQLEGLNLDFNGENSDIDKIPEDFKKLSANFNIKFKLATVDPKGKKTSGITYTKTDMGYFKMDNEAVKYNILGGKNGWSFYKYLNIWVCNLEYGLRGYSQFPGDLHATDGVVIDYADFGITNTGHLDNEDIPYHRILIHEVGHWLGLFHIWGDWFCGDDRIKDTPTQWGPHRYCFNEGGNYSCDSDDLTCNYMDYTPRDCMVMFTKGQKKRAMITMSLFKHQMVKQGHKLTK